MPLLKDLRSLYIGLNQHCSDCTAADFEQPEILLSLTHCQKLEDLSIHGEFSVPDSSHNASSTFSFPGILGALFAELKNLKSLSFRFEGYSLFKEATENFMRFTRSLSMCQKLTSFALSSSPELAYAPILHTSQEVESKTWREARMKRTTKFTLLMEALTMRSSLTSLSLEDCVCGLEMEIFYAWMDKFSSCLLQLNLRSEALNHYDYKTLFSKLYLLPNLTKLNLYTRRTLFHQNTIVINTEILGNNLLSLHNLDELELGRVEFEDDALVQLFESLTTTPNMTFLNMNGWALTPSQAKIIENSLFKIPGLKRIVLRWYSDKGDEKSTGEISAIFHRIVEKTAELCIENDNPSFKAISVCESRKTTSPYKFISLSGGRLLMMKVQGDQLIEFGEYMKQRWTDDHHHHAPADDIKTYEFNWFD